MKRLISLTLILTHLFSIVLHDASFAKEAKQTTSSTTQASTSKQTSTSQTNTKESSSAPKTRAAKMAALNSSSSQIAIPGFNASALQSLQNDPFTGRAVFSVPIAVPPGRRGIQPSLSLTYSSGSGNGILGVGWSLDLGSIQRSTKRGTPKYIDTQDVFVLASGGSTQELVSIGSGEYRPKLEGSFSKITYDGTSWVITDKSGAKFYFGLDEASKQTNPKGVFSWQLSKVVDIHGNYMTMEYTLDQGQLYPAKIRYTGNEVSPLTPTYEVEFILEDRADTSINYRSGAKVTTTKRLKQINVKYNSALVRQYKIDYLPLTNTRVFSLIEKVTLLSGDASESLPPIKFNYSQKQAGFAPQADWPLGRAWSGGELKHRAKIRALQNGYGTFTDTFDINGDGLPDYIQYMNNPSLWEISLNNGHGFEAPVNWPTGYTANNNENKGVIRSSPSDFYNTYSMETFDINGDGLPDRVEVENGSNWKVYLNNGRGFDAAISWPRNRTDNAPYSMIRAAQSNWGTFVDTFDISGDGLPDNIIYLNNRPYSWEVSINNGHGFEPPVQWPTGYTQDNNEDKGVIRRYPSGFYFTSTIDIFDINGDGLPDRVEVENGSNWKVYLNNGRGFDAAISWPRNRTDSAPYSMIRATQPGWGTFVDTFDINGDGLPDDIIYLNNRPYSWEVSINNGHGFDPSVTWPTGYAADSNENKGLIRNSYTVGENYSVTSIDALDINGDGLPDRVESDTTKWEVYPALESIPDYLSKIDNGLGGSTTITYKPYKGKNNTTYDPQKLLPFPVWVVESITQDDGAGSSYATSYSYDSGFFSFSEREFRGFGRVKATDPEGNYTESYFKQDDVFKGRLYKQETKDKFGTLLAKSENTWKSKEISSGVNFPYLERSDNFSYDTGASFRHTGSSFEYDTYGNPTKVISEGNIEESGDEKTQITEYTYNVGNWILATPKHTYIPGPNGVNAAEKWFYYDGSTSLTTSPSKGQLTKEEAWLSNPVTKQEERISSTFAYDSLGQLNSSTNAKGATTTTVYDTAVRIYPLTLTNSVGHRSSSTYNYATGQTLTSTDPNNQTSRNIYDSLGRLTKAIGPLDSEEYPGVSYEYDLASRPIKVTKKVKADYNNPPSYYTAYQFFDGLGRGIQAKSPAEADPDTGRARQIISGIVKFDSRGQVKEKYIPYFVSESADYVAPSFATPHSSLEYDALGRAVKATNPDGTSSSVKYSSRSKTTIDENGHQKSYEFDSYGRITEVREYTGTKEPYTLYSTTKYFYDTLGNLTSTTDNKNNSTTIIYDSLGRKLQMNDPDMGTWSYEYDKLGNLKKQTDAKGQILEFEYDSLNRLTKKFLTTVIARSPAESGATKQSLAEYIYDDPSRLNRIGRLSKVTYSTGSTEFLYDELGRETISIKIVDSIHYLVVREYDALDRLTKLIYPDGEVLTYAYNPQGIELVKGLSPTTGGSPVGKGAVSYVSNIDYSPTGQLTKVQYGNGSATNYHYDPNTLRLDHLTTSSSSATIQDLGYQFDNTGNIKEIRDSVNTATQSFIYDDLDRLKTAAGSYGTLGYDYDTIGNMTNKEGMVLEYNSSKPHAVTSLRASPASEAISISYDANGNMISKGSLALSYDSENRLIRAEDTTTAIASTASPIPKLNSIFNSSRLRLRFSSFLSYFRRNTASTGAKAVQAPATTSPSSNITVFSYDGDGGRVKKTRLDTGESSVYIGSLYEVNGSLITKHIFAGANRIATITGNNPSLRGSEIPSSLRATEGGEAISYYHPDHLGSSNVITDSTGKQVGFTEFTPFGSTFRQTGTYEPKHKFTGKELDSSTGLYYYGARYYDPQLGRFAQADTIVQAPYDPQSLNRYSYCRNNPLNYVDPTGHWWFIPLLIKAVVGAVVGSLIGGAISAITGGNVAQGFLTGAISGAFFGFTGGLGLSTGVPSIIGHTLAGAASGAVGASVTGGNIGMNAVIGGLSAGASLAAGTYVPFLKDVAVDGIGDILSNTVRHAAIGAVVGGSVSSAFGGSFGEGARYGAMTSAIAYNANCLAGALVGPLLELAIQRTFLFVGMAIATVFSSPQIRSNVQRAVDSLGVYFAKGKSSPQKNHSDQYELDKKNRRIQKDERRQAPKQGPPDKDPTSGPVDPRSKEGPFSDPDGNYGTPYDDTKFPHIFGN